MKGLACDLHHQVVVSLSQRVYNHENHNYFLLPDNVWLFSITTPLLDHHFPVGFNGYNDHIDHLLNFSAVQSMVIFNRFECLVRNDQYIESFRSGWSWLLLYVILIWSVILMILWRWDCFGKQFVLMNVHHHVELPWKSFLHYWSSVQWRYKAVSFSTQWDFEVIW